MPNNNKIKIDVELKTQLKNTQELYKEVGKADGFNPNGIKSSLKTISKLENATELTAEEYKKLCGAMQKVTNSLINFLSSTGKLSESAIELKKKIDDQITSIKNITKNQKNNDKTAQERKTTLSEKIGTKTIHIIDKDGKLGKDKLSEEEIATKLSKGERIGYTDDKGGVKEVTADSDIGKAALAYNETIEKANQLSVAFENATRIMMDYSTKLRDQMGQDLGVKLEKSPEAPKVEVKESLKEAPKEEVNEELKDAVKSLGDQLKENLTQLIEATKGLNLNEQQAASVAKHTKGAELALEAEDWKEFQKHFNSILKVFKDAASESENLSEAIQKLTSKQSSLSQEINALETTKTTLKNKLTEDGTGLNKTAVQEFIAKNEDAKKVILSDGTKATHKQILEIQEAVNKYLADAGKTLAQLKQADIEAINQKYGTNIKDRNSAFASIRYERAFSQEPGKIASEIEKTDEKITSKTEELDAIKRQLENVNTAAQNGADAINKLYIQINNLADSTNKAITSELNKQSEKSVDKTPAAVSTGGGGDPVKPVKEQVSGLGKAFKQFTIYQIALKGVKIALREAVTTVKELDKELTEQAMVTGLTRDQTYKLVGAYQDLAIQTGATTKEIAGVATEYIKQGKSIKDALTLTEAAVSAAKVAGVSTADSVNYLTTALNGFQLAAKDAMLVSDKFAAVAAASATDYDELAIALSKVASQANLAGMSIDYTTALLTKGLETTREAPETMGTALKTIIARMRELGDYGETLAGDTDINNVESQLAYVGIALRNTEGELRSTEDVLDELGKKWDTLDKNQQAAVAKALAGTRQQSRLIAMMTDYERVTELQQISMRSAGTTAAQADVYLQGIEASLNKVQVAWEKIVTSISNSDVITGLLDFVAEQIDNVSILLEDDVFTGSAMTALIIGASKMLGNKLLEQQVAKENHKQEIETGLLKAQNALEEKKAALEKAKLDHAEAKRQRQSLLAEKMKTAEKEKQNILDSNLSDEEKKKRIKEIDDEIAKIKEENEALDAQDERLISSYEKQITNGKNLVALYESQHNAIAANTTALMGYVNAFKSTFTSVVTYAKNIIQAIKNIGNASKAAKTHNEANSASVIPVIGWIIALIIEGAALISTIIATVKSVVNFIQQQQKKVADSAENTAKKIKDLGNEIYRLNERKNYLNQVLDEFKTLDNRIIKTKEDAERLKEILDAVPDKLDDQDVADDENIGYGKGINQKEAYENLRASGATYEELMDWLIAEEEKTDAALINKRKETIKELKDLEKNNRYDFYQMFEENSTDANVLSIQSDTRGNALDSVYRFIDLLKEAGNVTKQEAQALEQVLTDIFNSGNMNMYWYYVNNSEAVQELITQIQTLKLEIEDANGELQTITAAEILSSDDYGIAEKTREYRSLAESLQLNTDAYNALQEAYSGYNTFADMSDQTLNMLDKYNITADKINQLQDSYDTLVESGLNISAEQYKDLITNELLPVFAETNGNIEKTIDVVFGKYLDDVENYEELYDNIVTSFSNLIGKGVLNISQSVTKLKNSISSVYETASKWNDMSSSEQMDYITSNPHLFSGETGAAFLEAVQANDLKAIQKYLSENAQLQKDVTSELDQIEIELELERQKRADQQNQAHIKWLEERKKQLEDSENLFRADLQALLDQEQAQLDLYKDYLEKQQEALSESLDKRREAYESYFDAINQQQEDEDYQEQSDRLVENLSKLSTSTDMASQKQAKELQQQLEELEKERQQTLRERAQEAVINNIDKEVEDINDKFTKLLDNSQLLLEAMRGEVSSNPQFWTELMASARENGMTDLQLEEYGNEILSAFGGSITDVEMKEIQETIMNNATINIGDRTYDLNSEDGDAFWNLFQAIINKNGYS